jgi:transcription elongation factor Elf1
MIANIHIILALPRGVQKGQNPAHDETAKHAGVSTCRACGKVWHSLIEREQKLSKQDTCGMCGSAMETSGAELQQSKRNEAARESELSRLKRCPECGSANYSEEIVDHTRPRTG